MSQLYRIYIDYIERDQLYKTPHFMDQMFFADARLGIPGIQTHLSCSPWVEQEEFSWSYIYDRPGAVRDIK